MDKQRRIAKRILAVEALFSVLEKEYFDTVTDEYSMIYSDEDHELDTKLVDCRIELEKLKNLIRRRYQVKRSEYEETKQFAGVLVPQLMNIQ